MTCTDVQRVLPEIIEGGESAEFQTHLKSCPACLELVAELELIASEARQLAEVDEPPQRLWVKLAAELKAEGIIREPEIKPVLVPAKTARRWGAWWLAPIAAALIAGVSYYSTRQPAQPQVANQDQGKTTVQSAAVTPDKPAVQKSTKGTSVEVAKNSNHKPATGPADIPNVATALVSDDGQFMSNVSRQPAQMRATFESQLEAVNAYIRDAEAYVRQNPDDEDAKQQLINAYEQKTMLYQMALDQVQ